MNETDLWAHFKESRSEHAFRELVRRYTNLVYSAAKRRLAGTALAEEATQTVFIRLANTVPSLPNDAALAGWLHRTTVHVSIDLWRSESRRRHREEHAATMQPAADDNATWNDLSPVLDEALNQLSDADRQTLLLRFFDHKSMRELGTAFGVSEDAAKMRVSRALDRLREHVAKEGIICSITVLGTLLTQRAVEAAPAALLATMLCLSWPAPLAVSSGAALLHAFRSKIAVGFTAAALLGISLFFFNRSRFQEHATGPNASEQTETPTRGQATLKETNPVGNQTAGAEREPDPVKLLQTVARTREQIQSGTIELERTVKVYFEGNKPLPNGRFETNHHRYAVTFDAPKVRFDSVSREFHYTSVGSDESQRKIEEQGLDRESAVRAGYLQAFEAHVVSTYDGSALLQYRESDGKSQGAVIQDTGSADLVTNPQCLGLNPVLSMGATVKNCLPYEDAKSVTLIGKESVEGVPAWHVQLVSKYDVTLDYWIDAARPERMLMQRYRLDEVVSRYDSFGSCIPSETFTKQYLFGKLFSEQRVTRSKTELNTPVPPSAFTLAGLGMKMNTSVVDVRSHRSIGYWNGSGLEEFPSRQSQTESARAPDMNDLLTLLEAEPDSSQAFEAARWILFNTPDGPEVEKAAQVLRTWHLANTNLVKISERLESARYRCSTNTLETFLAKSPNEGVRGNACYLLAKIKKEEAHFGENQKATKQAIALFERVINEFGRNKTYGLNLVYHAKPELDELRRLLVGMPAPNLEGKGFDGESISLHDYRGKIVVVVFWCCGYSEAIEHRKFIASMEGKPVAFIGVSGDDSLKRAREGFAKYDITWPNIWDKQDGPLAKEWNVHSWPNVWVIDAKGVIRYRDARGPKMTKAVEALLAE
jgi:RNA polymerase sigma factor (sigma-70 family)